MSIYLSRVSGLQFILHIGLNLFNSYVSDMHICMDMRRTESTLRGFPFHFTVRTVKHAHAFNGVFRKTCAFHRDSINPGNPELGGGIADG